jgi:hypothetical protein
MSDMNSIDTGVFGASASVDEGQIRVSLRGNADMRAVPDLQTFIPSVHAKAMEIGVASVTIDMLQLEFMNSSCFRNFVNWLNWIRELPETGRYKLRFVGSQARHWQRPSLSALSYFAVGLVDIEFVAG